jgi:hypothetical protein
VHFLKQSTVGVKTMHSSDFSDAELLEDDSKSEEWFEELLEDDYPSISRSFPRCSTSSSMANHPIFLIFRAGRPTINFISVPAKNKRKWS